MMEVFYFLPELHLQCAAWPLCISANLRKGGNSVTFTEINRRLEFESQAAVLTLIKINEPTKKAFSCSFSISSVKTLFASTGPFNSIVFTSCYYQSNYLY